MVVWMATSLASRIERYRLSCAIAVLVGTALWLATSTPSAGDVRSMYARATSSLPFSDIDEDANSGGPDGGELHVEATSPGGYCVLLTPIGCTEGYYVPAESRASLNLVADIKPDQSGRFEVRGHLSAMVREPGSLGDFSNGWVATALYETFIDLDLPVGGKIAFLGEYRPRKVSGGTLWFRGGANLQGGHSITTNSYHIVGVSQWTTDFDSDGKPVFSYGTSTDPILPFHEDPNPETAPSIVPAEVTGFFLISGNQFLAPVVDEGHGTEDPIYFDGVGDEPDEPTRTRSAEGYAVVGMKDRPQFASFGIPSLDPHLGYQVEFGDVTLDVTGSEVVDFLATDAEGVATFLIRGLEEQTTEGIPGFFKMTFVEDGTAAFSVFPLVLPIEGDFDKSGFLDAADLDLQAAAMNDPNADLDLYDENEDGVVDQADRWIWVHDRLGTWIGDSDTNGQFDSGDFVKVFQIGKYETGEHAGWDEGDWSGDGVFDSGDFVIAFQDGGYEKGLRTPALAVPEPTSAILLLGSLVVITTRRRRFDP